MTSRGSRFLVVLVVGSYMLALLLVAGALVWAGQSGNHNTMATAGVLVLGSGLCCLLRIGRAVR